MAGACIARLLIPDLQRVRMVQALRFVGATALGAAIGALFGAWVNVKDATEAVTFAQYLHQVQIWWAGNWLGHLAVAPVVFCWLSTLRSHHPTLALKSRIELAVLALLLVGFSVYVFANSDRTVSSLLQMPTVVVGLMIYAAVRMPPRWVADAVHADRLDLHLISRRMRMGPFDLPGHLRPHR